MRNHIQHSAKKLGGQRLWRIRAKKDWLCVMRQQEKEQMLELPPLMTNKQILTHTQSRAPKTATFPASFPRGWPEGKGYSLAVDGGTPMEWKGEELNLLVPVCQCASWVVVCVGDFVSLPQFLESVLFSITCISLCLSAQYGDSYGVRTWVW